MKTAIFLNSGRKTERTVSADKIICADGGFDICPAKPDYIVGDCDSVHNIPEDVKVYRHDPRKNFTDGEAAVYLAKEIGSNEAIFYGVTGGRCDHVLGNIDIMALADYLGMVARAEENDCDIHFVHADEGTPFTLAVGKGRTVSIIPHGGDAAFHRHHRTQAGAIQPLHLRGGVVTVQGDAGAHHVHMGTGIV